MVVKMQDFVGNIKSFVPAKGWGFIECEDTFNIYGKDIFVMKGALGPTGHAEKGDAVSFSVEQGPSGPQATNVKFTSQGNRTSGMGQYVGVVKSYNPTKGWGLIECSETHAIYGKDMFVLRRSLPGETHIDPGVSVSFNVIEGLKGPEASEVQYVQARGRGPRPTAAAPQFSAVSPRAMPVRQTQPRQAAWVPQQPAWGPSPGVGHPSNGLNLLTHHAGEVKSFNEDKGWGFITPTSHHFGKDLFVMRNALPADGIKPGDNVQFKVKLGKKGYEADEVRVVPAVSDLQGETYEGTVKSYNASKGWGFIASDAVQQMFGRDILFHKRDLGDHEPAEGEPVSFSVGNNAKGQPQAKDLSFGGAYTAAKGVGKGRAKPF